MGQSVPELIQQYLDLSGEPMTALAEKLGTSQQNISRWKNDIAKPSDEAIVFKLKQMVDTLSTNLLSATIDLPLHLLSWNDFQGFCAQLFRITENTPFAVYGKEGDNQDGIDVFCTSNATAKSSSLIIQCKKTSTRKFGPKAVQAAIDKYNKGGREDKRKILAITKALTRQEQDAAAHNNWEIMGTPELSNLLKSIPDINIQKSIVRQFFPGRQDIIQNCLGQFAESRLVDLESFLGDTSAEEHLFNLSNQYVYQDEKAIKQLVDNAENDEYKILLIHGEAGVGKTRLIKELSCRMRKKFVALQRGQQPTLEDIDSLTNQHTLLIDDAHLCPQAVIATTGLLAKRKKADLPLLIITTRNYGLASVSSSIDISLVEFMRKYEVKRLNREKSIEVVESINDGPYYNSLLVDRANGLPLLLTIGARALKNNIHPDRLLDSSTTKPLIISEFDEIIKHVVNNAPNRNLARRLLNYIALIQPVPDDAVAREKLSKILNSDPVEISEGLKYLNEVGIIRPQYKSLRIAPDLLGDYLCEIFLANRGKPINESHIKVIFANLPEDFLANALLNICHLDWRLNSYSSSDIGCKKPIWPIIESYALDFASAEKLLDVLPTISYYQPNDTLGLLHKIITQSNNPLLPIAPLCLSNIAHNEKCLGRSVEFLFKLSERIDLQKSWRSGETPLDILKNIVKYELYKPIVFNSRAVDCIIAQKNNTNLPFSILDILDVALATDGTSSYADGPLKYTFQRFKVNPDNTKILRRKIIDLIFENLSSNEPVSALRAARSLECELDAISREGWDDELEYVRSKIEKWMGLSGHNSLILASVYLKISHLQHCKTNISSIKNIIALREKINIDEDVALAISILDCYGLSIFANDYNARKDHYSEWLDDNCKKILNKYKHHENELIGLICRYATTIAKSEKNDNYYITHTILRWLCKDSEEFCIAFVEYLIQHRESAKILKEGICPALNRLSKMHDIAYTLKYSKKFLATKEDEIVTEVAYFLITLRGESGSNKGLENTIRQLLERLDSKTHVSMLNALHSMEKGDQFAISMVNGLCRSSDRAVTAAIVNLLHPQYGIIEVCNLNHDALECLLNSLSQVSNLEYDDIVFLNEVAKIAPIRVIKLIEKRVEQSSDSLSPIPYSFNITLPVSANEAVFREIIVWIRQQKIPDYLYCHYGSLLIRNISTNKDRLIKEIKEILVGTDKTDLQVAKVIIGALPESVLWDNEKDIERILTVAKNRDEAFYDRILFSFYSLGIDGDWSRVVGEPSQRAIDLRQKSKSMLNDIGQNVPTFKLYSLLLEHAKADIFRAKQHDQELGHYD